VQALEHLVVRAQHERAVTVVAAPGRVASPGPVQLVVDTLLAVRADEIIGLDLAVQVESFADTAGDLRLAGIFRRQGIDVGLNVRVVAPIGGGGPPSNIIHAGAVAIQAIRRGIGEGFGFLRGAPGYEREGFGDMGRNGEVNRASMWAIDARLDLRASRV